jgi:hypothetical protein
MIYTRSIFPNGTECFTEARHITIVHGEKTKGRFIAIRAFDNQIIQKPTNVPFSVVQIYNSAGNCIRAYKSAIVIDEYGEENGLYVLVENE